MPDKNKIQFLNEEGSIRGAWIATAITVVTFTIFTIAFFWEQGAKNLAEFSSALVTAFLGAITIYFLKKSYEIKNGK